MFVHQNNVPPLDALLVPRGLKTWPRPQGRLDLELSMAWMGHKKIRKSEADTKDL